MVLGMGGTPKPIEVLSHDPLRYIGDMLAWIHQAMATERELLQTLLKLCPPEVLKDNCSSVQSQISEALCRPFKVNSIEWPYFALLKLIGFLMPLPMWMFSYNIF